MDNSTKQIMVSSTNKWQRKKEGRRTHIKRYPILYVDLVWKPDSNKPTGEGRDV